MEENMQENMQENVQETAQENVQVSAQENPKEKAPEKEKVQENTEETKKENVFRKVKGFLKEHKKLRIFIVILLILLLIILLLRSCAKKSQEAMLEAMNSGTISTVERRSLVESLAASGTVVSADSTDVVANVSGVTVLEVPVSVGDYVKEGDVICILDSEDLEINMNNTETTLEVNEEKADADIAIAKRGLSEAYADEEATVVEDLESVQIYYDKYTKALEDCDQAQREYDSAVALYEQRSKEYEDYRNEHQDLDEYEFLNKTERGNYYKSNMTSAESDMNSKKSTLDSKKTAVTDALNNYNNAVHSYEDHLRSKDSAIMTKNDSVKTANLNSETATLNNELQLKQYQDQVEACTVKATMDGVITAINVAEGGKYSGSTVATIEDDSSYEITAQIDEYDISKVKVGQRVVIKTNGTGDEELEGVVKEVAPRSTKQTTSSGTTTSSGSVNYKVTIDVTTPCDDLRMDMTAKLSIVIDEKDDVLTVPYDAVQTDEQGNSYIEVYKDKITSDTDAKTRANAEKTRVFVTKGIESDYYIEVSGDGIEEGVSVYVPENDSNGTNMMEMLMGDGAMGGF